MQSAALLVTVFQNVVGGVEKQDARTDSLLCQAFGQAVDAGKELFGPNVDRDRRLILGLSGGQFGIQHVQDQLRRKVVHAIIAHVLQILERTGLSCSAHAGHNK